MAKTVSAAAPETTAVAVAAAAAVAVAVAVAVAFFWGVLAARTCTSTTLNPTACTLVTGWHSALQHHSYGILLSLLHLQCHAANTPEKAAVDIQEYMTNT